ncbi:keratin-associated protein 5-1-like isoform X2 [Patiria miniata]|uniref:WAP domain-containing protein n=1 Tax=Patiria miniata TaxID=46514 RepID=A0A914BAU5_PATMI|nr:keratin-associated protein 5-1-like isoform X2 [Patiria miniata]
MKVIVLMQFVAFVATCVANPGHCPKNEGSVGGICVEECSSDSDCLSYQKCCSNGCGHTCLGILRPRIGQKPHVQCPSVDSDSVGICSEECSSDDECEAGEMCCSNGCGHTCVAAVEPPGKPGQCPMEEGRTDSGDTCTNDCGSDGDCGDELKCCSIGCSYVCTEPVRGTNVTKSGDCPVKPLDGFGICSESCSVDVDCHGDMKCCSNGCGHVCMNPTPETELGTCPEVVSGQVGACSEDCSSDEDCPGQQRCCSNGCGHTCTDTAQPIKQGKCPEVPEGVGGICSEDCSSDVDCEGDGKCCSNGCGHACMEPVEIATPKPSGQCPVVQDGALGICSEECSSDSDCEGAQQCCSNGCGHVCMDTTTPVVTTHNMDCRLGENYYNDGDSVPADEDCQTCQCIKGEVICMVRDPCKQEGLFSKALVMPIILSVAGVLLGLALMIVIIRCFLIRETTKRLRYKLMHEVPEFEPIAGASTGNVL